MLRQHRDISVEFTDNDCLDFNHGRVLLFRCKFSQGNQYFRYDVDTKQIYCGPVRDNVCIDVEDQSKNLITSICNNEKKTQKFIWGFINETMLRNWIEYGKPIQDLLEVEDVKKINIIRGEL